MSDAYMSDVCISDAYKGHATMRNGRWNGMP